MVGRVEGGPGGAEPRRRGAGRGVVVVVVVVVAGEKGWHEAVVRRRGAQARRQGMAAWRGREGAAARHGGKARREGVGLGPTRAPIPCDPSRPTIPI